MPKNKLSITILTYFALVGTACAPSHSPIPPGVIPQARPVTISEEQYGHQVLSELSEKFELDYNDPRLQRVEDIVARLTQAAGADKDPWHVFLFKDPDFKNAAATRGNHVFVWSGMLDATKSDDELATILGHEIAHVLAGHTDPDPNEEVKRLLIDVGAMAAGIAAGVVLQSPQFGQVVVDLTSQATQQIGNSLLVYPFTRELELEADRVGLMIMAEAKYNPEAAIEFWQRAQTDPDFSSSLQFLSSHPVATDRLDQLKHVLPLALARFRGEPITNFPADYPLLSQGATHSNSNPPDISPAINTATRDASTDMGNDSFDLRGAVNPTISSPQRTPTNANSLSITYWVVQKGPAVIYVRPSATSKALGELKRGAAVPVRDRKNGWLEILAPEHGFLKETNLTIDTKGR